MQARGEYLYIADGDGGFRVFDIAQINQKGFSEKIVSAPVSPFGQRTRVGHAPRDGGRGAVDARGRSRRAADGRRTRSSRSIRSMATSTSPICEEGLVLSTAATLLDGNPGNNILQRAAAFNPDGRLRGARNLAIAGNYAYIVCDRGLVVVDINTPLTPRIVGESAR